jgi:hypothetical protein
MPYNLEPRLDALESALERGALMRIDRSAASFQATASVTDSGATITGSTSSGQQVLQFQFNPETVTRTRAGQWDPRVKRQQAKIPPTPEVRADASMGSSALLAESEQISLKIVFDATEALLAGRPEASTTGILSQLAFLEIISEGREGTAEDPKKADKTKEVVQPVRPDELILVLGAARLFPVVLTNLTIVEQKFLPTLVPLRAEVELKFTVLESDEARYSTLVNAAFEQVKRRRIAAATDASAPSLVDKIWAAIEP